MLVTVAAKLKVFFEELNGVIDTAGNILSYNSIYCI